MFEDINCKDVSKKNIMDHRDTFNKKERISNVIKILKSEETSCGKTYLDEIEKDNNCDFIEEMKAIVFYMEYGYIE